MDLKIKGKRALITGASHGLGRAVARILAAEGARICAVARDTGQLGTLLDEMGGEEQGHIAAALDLTAQDAIPALCDRVTGWGDFDIIVHNLGGTLGIRDPLGEAGDFHKVWYFNLGIALEINRLFIPAMQRGGWGRIVHVSSSSAVMADASLAYSSAKAAVNTYVKGLGREMAKYGIIVTAIMPGPFIAPGGHWENVARNDPERYRSFANERMAVKRLGEPGEIGQIIAMLCSEHASFMAGAVVPVDGGIR